MITVSIIMPLFNAEKYLKEALLSISKQTYTNYELICIDDSSTDATREILNQFQQMDSRIRILENHKRLGAALSRNKGIEAANGRYITFLDGDDIFEEELLEIACDAMEKNAVDIVMYEYMHTTSESIYEKRKLQRGNQFIENFCRQPFKVAERLPIEFMNWSSSPCNKLYRKSFIEMNKLEFQTLSSANDVYFVVMALLLASKIIMLEDRRVMVYARDHFEPTRISFDRDPMCVYQALKKIGEVLKKRGLFATFFQHYYCFLYYYLRMAILKTKKEENRIIFYDFLQQEGISTLINLDSNCYHKVDRYMQSLIEKFQNSDFHSMWYRYENTLSYYLDNHVDKVISLIQFYHNKEMQIALWGAGDNGSAFIGFLKENHIEIDAIIDKDQKKWGKEIGGYVVQNPEEVLNKVQVVLFSTFSIYSEVAPELEACNVKAIEIGEIVGKD